MTIFVGALGLVIGSFLNAVIYRLPRKISFGASRSMCPSCQKQIAWYDNIPLVSYLVLLGKCRQCRAHISWRYPFIEALTAGVFVFLYIQLGLSWEAVVAGILSSALIAIFFIDLDHMIIPDRITLPGAVAGLALSLVPGGIGIFPALIGAAFGGGALYGIALLGDWLFKKESMGGGDIKMAAMLGAFVGWQKVFLIFFGSAIIGLLFSVTLFAFSERMRRERVVPFGPFLAVAGFVALVAGDRIISLYLQYLRA